MNAPNEPKGGRVIAGKFRLEWPIGRGGMGTVWAAMHLQLDMPVAVKFMDPSAADADGRQRFEREARAIAQLRSPHVVQVLDHGVDGGMPYIVMELLEGEDLEGRLRRVKKLPIAVATRIFTQSAKALRRAHDAGIIHRDLKPNNVFLARVDDEEIVKLLDFGVAKMTWTGALDPHNESTQQGLLLGSPCYMSPEQARGNKNVDHRSDLWALAVILFRSITGVRPFDAATIADLIIKICAEPPPVASEISPDLPAGIDDFFFRAFSHDPDQRYQSALEMASDFEALVRNHAPTADTFSGGRIVSAPQRAATNPAIQTPMPGVLPRTASNPGLSSSGVQRTATNPAMRAISMSGQLVPANPPQRQSYANLPAYDPTAPQPPAFTPSPAQASPGAPPAYPPAPRLSYPGDPSVAPEGFGSGVFPGQARRPSDPIQSADPYAQGYAEQRAPDVLHGYPTGDAPGYGEGELSPGQIGQSPAASEPDEHLGAPLAQGDLDVPVGAFADPSAPSMPGYDGGSAPTSGAPPPNPPPDSTQTHGATSNTLRERSPSGRQLVVWTTVAAMLTAILVVAIFIVARSRQINDGRGTSAKPPGTADVGLPQPTSQRAPSSSQGSQDPQQPPPATDPTAAPSETAQATPPAGGWPYGGPGAPSASASASAAPPEIPAVPFGIEEDAGAPSPPPPATHGPKPTWNPSGKKPKPNFGY